MTAYADSTREPLSFLRFLARELAPREGRGAAVARISLGCAITVTIAMVFRIPQPTYMAYLVFVISKDERAATFKSAIGGLLAVTIALIASLVLFTVDVAEPAIRLPAMAITTFVAMYTSRTFALGPISFLAGFVLVVNRHAKLTSFRHPKLTRVERWFSVDLRGSVPGFSSDGLNKRGLPR